MSTQIARRSVLIGVIAASALALSACSQSSSSSSTAAPASSSAAPESSSAAPTESASAATKPAPFADGPVSIALVRQSGAGDYFTAWGAGAQKQAAAAGIDLLVYDAQQDNAKQATDLQTAIASKPAAIIIDHGLPETIEPLIDKAVAAKIPVIVYDAAVKARPGVIITSQSDESMAEAVLGQAVTDLGKGAKVGHVFVPGFAPLDRRATVFKKVVADNEWKVAFTTGKVSASTATDTAPLVDAALKQNPDVVGIFAPYDELAKGTLVALKNNKLTDKVKVYGIDISTADIGLMTEAGSPWVATAATDPAAVGAAVVRTTALQLAGQLNKGTVEFPASLITAKELKEKSVTNMETLRAALPALSLSDQVIADWLPAVSS